jgi:hypothetical protein
MNVTPSIRVIAAGLGRAVFAFASTATLLSCGSGAVTDNTVTAPTAITILPSSATLYSGLPTTFSWSGGNGSYIVASSDQATIPVGGSTTATTLTVIPAPVNADTQVTLTIRDTAGSQSTAALTVKPSTISNVVTVTPSPTQAAACGTALCSGGDAEVRTTLVQNGVPLSNRDVRFDVISGDVRFIVGAAGTAELLATSTTARTDSAGTASVRIRAFTDAAAQTALLQITDVAGGFSQRASVAIYPVSASPLVAAPSTIQFVGENSAACAIGRSADVIIFGGRPPYLVSQPPGFSVFPTTVLGSGQRFTVAANGTCISAQPISVVDTNGATAVVTVSNVVGPITVTPPTFAAAPTAVTLDSCTDVANIALVGGTGTYFAASGSGALTASASGNTGTIRRTGGTTTPPTSTTGTPPTPPLNVAFSDGRTSVTVQVSIGAGASACP